ncbi:cytosolic Fe-S cluster assembly factor NBP35, putative [Plasmodium vinckei]|uniref:Cytosolic Fe-S cluster assembly factor NBP35, putative n=1 Tax=Plasmodium vinckei TaxID=5860 RepID=A0A6V7T1Y7_PLAVN|nr:cytosolic Fe-S cluster assembly factor NBP35, putative [Plasmodium vinckei]
MSSRNKNNSVIIPFLIGTLASFAVNYYLNNRKTVDEFIKQHADKILKKFIKNYKRKQSEDDSIPNDCPGIDSEHAGKSRACDGCPNRKICNDPELKKQKENEKNQIFNEIQENLKNVKYKILILSGKGGVGKSTIASQLAFALSHLNYDVGLLDIDICGPSIPVLTKTIDSDVNYGINGWIPIYKNNLSIMSVGYLLPNFDDPVIWRGPKKNGLIKQFLCDVYWKNLDFLIIDTPPGTSDEHLTICSYLKDNLDGCLIVTTPHILSIYDVKKEIEFCKKTNIPILGVIENMFQSIFVSNYTVQNMCSDMNVDYAGHVTFDQNLIDACHQGIGCCDIDKNSTSSKEIFSICKFLAQKIYAKYSHQIDHIEPQQLTTDQTPIDNTDQNDNNNLPQEKSENNQLDETQNIMTENKDLSKTQVLEKIIRDVVSIVDEK